MSNSNKKLLIKRLVIFGTAGFLLFALLACNVLPTDQISSLLRDLADKVESPDSQSQKVEQGQAEPSESQTQVQQVGNSSTEGKCSEHFGKIIYRQVDHGSDPVISDLIITDENGNILDRISFHSEINSGFAGPAWSPNHCRIAFHTNSYNYVRNNGQTEQPESKHQGQSESQTGATTSQGQLYPTPSKLGASVGQAPSNQSQGESGASVAQPQSSQSETSGSDEVGGENVDIYTMDPDGTDVVRLTDSPRYEQHPDWSPDGKQIVYESGANEGPGGIPVKHIYIMDADGFDQHLLSDVDDFLRDPEWSPDGKRIVFECKNPGRPATGTLGAVCVIDADGKNLMRITPVDKNSYAHPAWSPDGTQIAISYAASDIGIMNADGSNFHLMHVKGLYGPQDLKWSPDGKRLVVEDIGTPNEDRYYDLSIVDLKSLESKLITEGRPAIEETPDW